MGWWQTWKSARRSQVLQRRPIPEPLWRLTLARYGFLDRLDGTDRAELRELSTLFLADKEFHGAGGLLVNDAMAVAIAAQACLPVLRLGLEWYSGFKGIVVHADAVLAQREFMDETGVVHEYEEELSGEAMEGGPVMLSWRDVEDSGESAGWGYNVVIHEFAHVLDMRDGAADGVPPLPDRAARQHWLAIVEVEYSAFCAASMRASIRCSTPTGRNQPENFSRSPLRASSQRRKTCASRILPSTNCWRTSFSRTRPVR